MTYLKGRRLSAPAEDVVEEPRAVVAAAVGRVAAAVAQAQAQLALSVPGPRQGGLTGAEAARRHAALLVEQRGASRQDLVLAAADLTDFAVQIVRLPRRCAGAAYTPALPFCTRFLHTHNKQSS